MFATPYSRYLVSTLPWYSVLIVTGIIAALAICFREEKRLGLPRDTTVDLALWIIPCGIIGARLYYVAFAWDVFRQDPLSILRIWEGGLAIYGGVIGGLAAGLVFSRKRRLSVGKITDMVAPGLALAQAIGRWGNYFNQEAYGALITDPAWQFFPAGVLVSGQWYMATFFYESLWNLAVFAILMLSRRRTRRHGDAFLWYAALYGAGRFVIEGLRSDSLMAGTLRVSQLLSLGLCAGAGVWFLIRALRQGRSVACILSAILAATAAATLFVLPLSLTLRHALLSAVLLLNNLFIYIQIRPAMQEDMPCHPQH